MKEVVLLGISSSNESLMLRSHDSWGHCRAEDGGAVMLFSGFSVSYRDINNFSVVWKWNWGSLRVNLVNLFLDQTISWLTLRRNSKREPRHSTCWGHVLIIRSQPDPTWFQGADLIALTLEFCAFCAPQRLPPLSLARN